MKPSDSHSARRFSGHLKFFHSLCVAANSSYVSRWSAFGFTTNGWKSDSSKRSSGFSFFRTPRFGCRS